MTSLPNSSPQLRSKNMQRPPGGLNTGTHTPTHGGDVCGSGRGLDMRRAGRERHSSAARGAGGINGRPGVRGPALHCGETAHIRSGSGCGAVGPRHRAGPGARSIQRRAGRQPRLCASRPGLLVRGGETVTRCAHNAEIPSSILGPAIVTLRRFGAGTSAGNEPSHESRKGSVRHRRATGREACSASVDSSTGEGIANNARAMALQARPSSSPVTSSRQARP